MDPDVLEECLQTAAEQSSAWALIRETGHQAWVLVLSDESLVDIACSECGQLLTLRAELGMIVDAAQRCAVNDLVLRCTGVIPMPTITLGSDQRYEAMTHWRIDPRDALGLATLFEDFTVQLALWREVVVKPMAHDVASPDATPPERTPAFGAFA